MGIQEICADTDSTGGTTDIKWLLISDFRYY